MFEREIVLSISHFYVAQLDATIVGYGGYWRIQDEGHIVNLAVHPEYRSQGCGREILKYLLSEMQSQDIRAVFLEVRRGNEAAQNLYLSYGFKIIGIRPKYYGNEDAIVMERNFSEPRG
jgi:ribosomal-protein-alanine N-acetyltransferase